MCFHTQHIWTICGHSVLSAQPIAQCKHAGASKAAGPSTSTCTPMTHPYQIWRIDKQCPTCEAERNQRLGELARARTVQFDEWRWRVSYAMPATGKDFWGRKAEEREAAPQETPRATGMLRPKGELRRRAFLTLRRSKEKELNNSREN